MTKRQSVRPQVEKVERQRRRHSRLNTTSRLGSVAPVAPGYSKEDLFKNERDCKKGRRGRKRELGARTIRKERERKDTRWVEGKSTIKLNR